MQDFSEHWQAVLDAASEDGHEPVKNAACRLCANLYSFGEWLREASLTVERED